MSTSVITITGGQSGRSERARRLFAKYEERIIRAVIIIALFAIPIHMSATTIVINDPDIWWHLRLGEWIVKHGAVPATDMLSAYGMGKPFVAYSWLFEALIYGVYQMLGMFGFVLFNAVMAVVIGVALYTFVRKLEPRFANFTLLTCLCLLTLPLSPRPWLFTILFFIIEVDILLTTQKSGNYRRLLLLPPLFTLWANIHIQFIYGLFVLCLACVEPLICLAFRRASFFNSAGVIPALRLWPVAAACALATLLNPYHFKVYYTVLEIAGQSGVFNYVTEMRAPAFRFLSEWVLLFLVVGASFAVGWRKECRPLELMLLVAGIVLSFRTARDAWFVAVVATAIIAATRQKAEGESYYVLTKGQFIYIAACVVGIFLLIVQGKKISQEGLQDVLAKDYPVVAVNFVEKQNYPGPLYNHFNWGGFLIWHLPRLPVSMDGRTNVYGDERIERSTKTWSGGPGWESDSDLAAANVVVAGAKYPLTSLLRYDGRFELVYEDKVAAVFVKRSGP